ncbi:MULTISPECIES: hypothetical protein [unclassified Phaeobacter]|uniref:hypothetical protein n=1 Tax=unclassified Phaeobacter TaxID=2621772 RepID=UPI003A8428AF
MKRNAKLLLASCVCLIGCAPLDYSSISKNGRFEGRLFVMWIGEGSPYLGDGNFVFVPNPNDPLRFTRYDAAGNQVGETIRPELMYTDGGSIPKLASAFRGFSPWGYAPAYMIHDWLFIAHHCLVDGVPTEEEAKMSDLTFRDSAVIIAESIKALQVSGQVSRNDIAASTISSTVAGPISSALWNRNGACEGHRVSEEHRIAALAAFPDGIRADAGDVGLDPDLPIPDGGLIIGPKATVIGEFGF